MREGCLTKRSEVRSGLVEGLVEGRRLEEIRKCSNKELKVTRELLERVRSLKEYATLGKQK